MREQTSLTDVSSAINLTCPLQTGHWLRLFTLLFVSNSFFMNGGVGLCDNVDLWQDLLMCEGCLRCLAGCDGVVV